MSNEEQTSRPLLSKYEVEIPDRPASRELQYDEEAMVLMIDGRAAVGDPDPPVPPGTKITFVGQETTDDD
jgi:hypothetical protein